jgi:glycosyltransferase involved in cell wall biosynthesis
VVIEGQNGLIVPVGDEKLFTEAIEQVLSNKDYAKKLKEGARTTNFSALKKEKILSSIKENLEKISVIPD